MKPGGPVWNAIILCLFCVRSDLLHLRRLFLNTQSCIPQHVKRCGWLFLHLRIPSCKLFAVRAYQESRIKSLSVCMSWSHDARKTIAWIKSILHMCLSLSWFWLCDPWTIAYQDPLSVGFPRQEYWSALPFPPPGDLPNRGIKPASPALQADSVPSEPPGNPKKS